MKEFQENKKGGGVGFTLKIQGFFGPEVDIYAFMYDRCQDGVRMCTLRPRASAQWLVRGRVSGFQNMRTTHRHIYIYTIGTLCLHVGDSRKF